MELDYIEEQHLFQRLNKATYQHMMDRMKKDLIALTMTINDLTDSLRHKKIIMADEQSKETTSRE
jgi:hypothetical protein